MEYILRKYKEKIITDKLIKILVKELKENNFNQEVVRSYRNEDD
jgi:hypothetical protein